MLGPVAFLLFIQWDLSLLDAAAPIQGELKAAMWQTYLSACMDLANLSRR